MMGPYGTVWTPEVRAFYAREFGDDSTFVKTSFAVVPDVVFNAGSGKWGRDSVRAGTGLGIQWGNRLGFRLDYDFEVHNHTNSHNLGAVLSFNW
jgi:outer membrane autotransporter protein